MSYFNLGSFKTSFTTTSPEAQTWLNNGFLWLFGFNHEEAVVCFEKAITADPNCIMANWGIAHAIGPNYNKVWEFFSRKEKALALERAHKALRDAKATYKFATPIEISMVDALFHRFPSDPTIEDYTPWNDAFSNSMRKVYSDFSNNLDVTAIFAEALMNRAPWNLWDLKTGKPTDGASTQEAKNALEKAFSSQPEAWEHPGLLHMYIHLMEMSPNPEKALPHGDKLVDLVPDSGHLVHMATHIDVLCGDYQNVVWRNNKASIIDKKFFDYAGGSNFYTIYRIHNLHFKIYGAMFLAQPTPALSAAQELLDILPEPVVRFLPEMFESFVSMKIHVLIRFGKWEDILCEVFPDDAELYSYTTAMLRYARTVALANLGKITEASAEKERFLAAKKSVQEDRAVFNNPCSEILLVAEQMMLGELAYKAGHTNKGLEHLRKSVQLDDELLYDEPWGWMQPTRHALGALLIDSEFFYEAEAVYRADLGLDNSLPRPSQHPRNVWSLHGLNECLEHRGENLERQLIRQLLDQALARAEIPIKASCYCRSEKKIYN
jgi:tetratricopeptide (TPR) repeat protein